MARIIGTILNDNLQGTIDADNIEGLAGADTLNGLAGIDLMNGGDGNDVMDGGDGDDNISGNKGNDTMIGGAGDDRLFWIDGDGSDVISGGAGLDSVEFTGASRFFPPGRPSQPAGDTLTLTRDLVSDAVILSRTNLVPITLKIDSVELISVSGVEGDDRLTVGSLFGSSVFSIRFSGGTGNDFLDARNNGTATMNIFGDADNDVLQAGNQSDFLEGGSGNDLLFGNNGNDTLVGVDPSGNPGRGELDVLTGGAGRDRFILGDREGVNRSVRAFYDDGDNVFDGGNNIFTGMDGVSDFARITDFAVGLDVIQLGGSANDYVIRNVDGALRGGSAAQDVGIFKKRPSLLQPDELIAVVHDVGGALNLNSGQFVFV